MEPVSQHGPAGQPAGRVPAAASTRAPAWLTGPDVRARVLAAAPYAHYLLPVSDDAADLLVLVDPRALRLPGAVLVPGGLGQLGTGAGTVLTVGGGLVHAPAAVLEVRRTWRPRRVPVGAWSRGPATVAAVDAVPPRPGRSDLADLAAAALDDPARGVEALVGLGPGLTPSGDDVLCGLLLVLGATSPEVRLADGRSPAALHDGLASAVAPVLPRTTALSTTLLRAAADGYAVPPAVDLLAAGQGEGGGTADLGALARALAAIGHTSGNDLLVGIRAALHLLDAAGPVSTPAARTTTSDQTTTTTTTTPSSTTTPSTPSPRGTT